MDYLSLMSDGSGTKSIEDYINGLDIAKCRWNIADCKNALIRTMSSIINHQKELDEATGIKLDVLKKQQANIKNATELSTKASELIHSIESGLVAMCNIAITGPTEDYSDFDITELATEYTKVDLNNKSVIEQLRVKSIATDLFLKKISGYGCFFEISNEVLEAIGDLTNQKIILGGIKAIKVSGTAFAAAHQLLTQAEALLIPIKIQQSLHRSGASNKALKGLNQKKKGIVDARREWLRTNWKPLHERHLAMTTEQRLLLAVGKLAKARLFRQAEPLNSAVDLQGRAKAGKRLESSRLKTIRNELDTIFGRGGWN